MRLHLVPNSHIDPVWLWDKYEGIDEVLNTFRTACDHLAEFPGLTYTASSLQFYEWVQRHDAALFDRIGGYVAAGRWEVVGGWWVEADSNLPSGLSLARHASYSQAFAERYFGRRIEVAYLIDSFGHPATLPTVLTDAGFRYFIFCRPGAHENPYLPANLFHWEHAGHRVLAYRLKHHYLQYGAPAPAQVDPNYLLPKLNDAEYQRAPVNCYLFGVGDHGGGPARAEIEFYREFCAGRPAGDAGFSSCARFFAEAAQSPAIPTYSGDLHMHAVGCYAVVRPLKAANRRAEQKLAVAERALALAGQPAAALDDAWKTTLFNQFHDILPGSCAPQAAAQAQYELGGVAAFAQDTAYAALKRLTAAAPVRCHEGEFRVCNTLPFPVTVPLALESFMYYQQGAAFRDEAGRELAVQEVLPSVRCANRRWEFVDTLPAGGFKSYWFDNATRVTRPAAGGVHFTAGAAVRGTQYELREDGAVLRADGRGGFRPLLEAPARWLVLADRSDTWGHGVRAYDDVIGEFKLESSATLVGPVTSKLHQCWRYGDSTLEVTWSLYEALAELRADVLVRWVQNRQILKLELRPFGNREVRCDMQAPGGGVTRPADGAELPLHHWVRVRDWHGDFVVLQDGAFGADYEVGRLRLTLVRSNYYGYHDPTQLGPVDPQHRTDQGEHQFRLALLSVGGLDAAGLDARAAAFIEPYACIREGWSPARG